MDASARFGALKWGLAGLIGVLLGAILWLALPSGTRTEPGPARLGGPFELTDHQGERVGSDDFAGRPMLIYFGYSYCPDFCPMSLATMADALDQVGDRADDVAFLFVSVDPERDTIEHLAQYVELFDPRLIGLTGSREDIDAVTSAYRIYYDLRKDETEGDDYFVDHSTYVYLMDRDHRFVRHFAHDASAEEIAAAVREAL